MAGLDFSAVVAAGFLATLVMTMVGYLLGVGGLTYFDLDRLLVDRWGTNQSAPGLGMLLHFLLGIGLAAVYVLLWHPMIGGPALLTGLLFGAALWLIGMVLILPLVGQRAFAAEHGWRGTAALLVTHVVFGVLVAVFYPALVSG